MAQVKVYGLATTLNPIKKELSDVVHSCIVEALNFPIDKRAHRFFAMDPSDFFIPAGQGRTNAYTIIEISMFEGRSVTSKKELIRLLFERVNSMVNITPADLEITIFETPRSNWGFRGQPGDEIALGYKVDV